MAKTVNAKPSESVIYRMYITVKGRKIYRRNGRPFKIVLR